MDSAVARPAIATHGLTKRFGRTVALDGVDLEVPPATSLALLGPRGAGKTTLVRLLSGLARPSSGYATVAGSRVGGRGWVTARRRLGVAPSDARFHGWMTGREVVDFAAQLAGLPSREHRSRVDEVLGRVGLAGAAAERVSTYSESQRHRVGLAQAIVGRPAVVLVDEPGSSLGPDERAELLAALDEVRRDACLVVTTRFLADAELVADRVALLDQGRLLLQVPVAELLDRVAQPIYAIEVERGEGPALGALNARLRQEAWVAWTAIEAAAIRVAVSDPGRAAKDLLPLVVAAGVTVAGFGRRRPTLDDLLAQLSGDARREGPAT